VSDPVLSAALTDAAFRLAGLYPAEWLCPVCGAFVRDEDLIAGSPRPPVHEHYRHQVEFVERPQL
jgi:hypothetical protein